MLPQIQIKYLKPKPLNGYTKPLGRLSMRQDVHMLFYDSKGQRMVICIWPDDCSQGPPTVTRDRSPLFIQADSSIPESPTPSQQK